MVPEPVRVHVHPGLPATAGHHLVVDTAKVREWARGQGIEVKDRGRVPADVVEQYKTAAGVQAP
jgi:hypothetical protein